MVRVKAPKDPAQRLAWTAFQQLPNIGPAMAMDFVRLGVQTLDQLEAADPDEMYLRIGRMDGVAHDPCVLDTYRAAVHNLRTGEEKAWWEFSRERLAATGGRRSSRIGRRAP
jgi:hypothetical protein